MPEAQAPVLRVDPAKLEKLVGTYEHAANRVFHILDRIARDGRIEVPWTQDRVSVEMVSHYNTQVFDGEYSTYAALKRYEVELRAVARTLRRMLDDYERTEAEAVAAIRSAGSTGG